MSVCACLYVACVCVFQYIYGCLIVSLCIGLCTFACLFACKHIFICMFAYVCTFVLACTRVCWRLCPFFRILFVPKCVPDSAAVFERMSVRA